MASIVDRYVAGLSTWWRQNLVSCDFSSILCNSAKITTCELSQVNSAPKRVGHVSHTRTVRECCKGDEASQWRNPKFDPPPRPNPGDRNTNRHRWFRRGPLQLCNNSSRSAQAFRFCARVTLHTKNVLVFGGVFATRYSQGPWTDFDAKYAKTCGSTQGCAFSGSRTQNLISRPPFSRISAILGTIFDGTENFLLKIA